MQVNDKIATIRNEILAEAKAKCDAIMAEAEKWRQDYEQSRKARFDAEAQKVVADARRDAEQRYRQLVLSAQLEQKNRTLKKESELIAEVYAGARAALEELRKDENYVEWVKAMVIEAVLKLKDDDLLVLIDPRDEKVITPDLLNSILIIITFTYNRAVNLDVAEERVATAGGIVIKVKDKHLYINNTFEERLSRQENAIKNAIAREVG